MKERRKHSRSLCFVSVYDQTEGDLIGHVSDIHHKGLGLISKNEIPLLSDIPVSLQDPERNIEISLVIRGIWNRTWEDPFYYSTGCQIVSASPEIKHSINNLLEKSIKRAERHFVSIQSSSPHINT